LLVRAFFGPKNLKHQIKLLLELIFRINLSYKQHWRIRAFVYILSSWTKVKFVGVDLDNAGMTLERFRCDIRHT